MTARTSYGDLAEAFYEFNVAALVCGKEATATAFRTVSQTYLRMDTDNPAERLNAEWMMNAAVEVSVGARKPIMVEEDRGSW